MRNVVILAIAIAAGIYITVQRFQHRYTPKRTEHPADPANSSHRN